MVSSTQNNPSLTVTIKEKLGQFETSRLEPCFSKLKDILNGRADAIVAYGSVLSKVTASKTSTPDFYVVVPSYRKFYGWGLEAFINWFLPPNIYHFKAGDIRAKYNVISRKDLKHETGEKARDVYHIGRFSKRIALVSFDNGGDEHVIHAQQNAMTSIAKKIFFQMPRRFTLDSFCMKALAFSYVGDVRVEAQDKIEKLFKAEADFYRGTYRYILQEMCSTGWGLQSLEKPDEFERTAFGIFHRWKSIRVSIFLAFSRLRAQMRWPKGMITVDGWVDYMIDKIERTQNVKIDLTPKQRKLWFIYGWKVFFMLRKKNLIK